MPKNFRLMEASRLLLRASPVHLQKTRGRFYLFNDLVLLMTFSGREESFVCATKLKEFKYVIGEPEISFEVDKHAKSVRFDQANEKMQFLSRLENARLTFYEKSGVTPSLFIWSQPFVMQYEPIEPEVAGVMVWQICHFYGGDRLITYCSRTGVSKTIQSPIPPRQGYSFNVAGNRFFIFGGKYNHDFVNEMWTFEALTGNWAKLPLSPAPSPRTEHSAIVYDGKLFVFGGRFKRTYHNDIWAFDIAHSEWVALTRSPQAPEPRCAHSAVVYGHQMIIYGGHNGNTTFNDMCAFDLETYQWSRLDIDIHGRFGHRSLVIHNYIFHIGGSREGWPSLPTAVVNYETKEVSLHENGGNTPARLDFIGVCAEDSGLVVAHSSTFYTVQYPKKVEEELNRIGPLLKPEAIRRPVSVSREEGDASKRFSLRTRMSGSFKLLRVKTEGESPELEFPAEPTPPESAGPSFPGGFVDKTLTESLKEFDSFELPYLPEIRRAQSMEDLGENDIDGRFRALLMVRKFGEGDEVVKPPVARTARRSTLPHEGKLKRVSSGASARPSGTDSTPAERRESRPE
jgi:hypothetical protein